MKSRNVILLVIVFLILLGIAIFWYVSITSKAQTPAVGNHLPTTTMSTSSDFVSTKNWKTFTDPKTGFSLKYPSQYTLILEKAPREDWRSREYIKIDDQPNKRSPGPRAIPFGVNIIKQPMEQGGTVYHTVAEYQKGDIPMEFRMQNALHPNGTLVEVNGIPALYFQGTLYDATGTKAGTYLFIHDDLIYEVGFSQDFPLSKKILDSIHWQ